MPLNFPSQTPWRLVEELTESRSYQILDANGEVVCDDSGYYGSPLSLSDARLVMLMHAVCCEHAEAQQLLRDAGYGVAGTPLLESLKPALQDATADNEFF